MDAGAFSSTFLSVALTDGEVFACGDVTIGNRATSAVYYFVRSVHLPKK
jgi:hypothetical protein